MTNFIQKFILKLLNRLWSLWVLFIFIFFYLVIFPFHVLFLAINTKLFQIGSHYLNCFWAISVLTLGLAKIKTIRLARLKLKQNYVFASNHRSYIDIPIGHIVLFPFTFKYIAKAELAKVPLFGYMYKRLHIMIDRSSKEDRSRSLSIADSYIKKGQSLYLFPEGTTKNSNNKQLGPLKDGAFILAIQNHIPLVPIAIINSNKALSNDGKFKVKPLVRLYVIICEPIDTTTMVIEDVPKLRATFENTINRILQKYNE